MMAYEPPSPLAGFPLRNASGHRYEAHVYQRPIFPLSAGRVAIPPARLLYAMPLSYSFFSREESFELRSDSAVVVALDPPRAGRPADWTGAVGTLRLSAAVDSASARVGDAMRLVVRVSGEGNVKLFPRPALALPWATATAEGERVTMSRGLDAHRRHQGIRLGDDAAGAPGAWKCRRCAIRTSIRTRGNTGRGERARRALHRAGRARLGGHGLDERAPRWLLRSRYRGELPPPLYRSRCRSARAAAAASARARARRARVAPRESAAARCRQRSRCAHSRAARRRYARRARIRRSFLSAAADRLERIVDGARRARGAAPSRAPRGRHTPRRRSARRRSWRSSMSLHSTWRASGRVTACSARTISIARSIARRVRAAHRAPRATHRPASPFSWLSRWPAARTRPIPRRRSSRAASMRTRAASSLQRRATSRRSPRTSRARADAWANIGTAAYSAGDTARALVGWQRALRLEPLAADVRDRLDLISPDARVVAGIRARDPAAAAGRARRRALAARMGLAGLAGAHARGLPRRRFASRMPRHRGARCASASRHRRSLLDRRINAADLAVVAHDAPLHVLPALASDRGATLRTGDIARVLEAEGAWARVVSRRRPRGMDGRRRRSPIPHD